MTFWSLLGVKEKVTFALSLAATLPRALPSFLHIKCYHSPLNWGGGAVQRYPLAFHQLICSQSILLVTERISLNTKTQLLLELRPLSLEFSMFTNKPPLSREKWVILYFTAGITHLLYVICSIFGIIYSFPAIGQFWKEKQTIYMQSCFQSTVQISCILKLLSIDQKFSS